MVLCVLLTVVSITEGLITTAEEAFCVPVLKLGDLGAREGSQWVLFEGFEFCDFWYGSRRVAYAGLGWQLSRLHNLSIGFFKG
jgi:hypothetical protein